MARTGRCSLTVWLNCIGLDWRHYIKQLIHRPHKEVHVTDLVTGANDKPVDVVTRQEEASLLESGVAVEFQDEDEGDSPTGQVVTSGFQNEILSDDDRAYVLKGLENEHGKLAALISKGLPREVLLKKEEIQRIQQYLDNHRYRGKNRCFDNRSSRDRSSVANAITRAIGKIGKIHPALAEHLHDSIETGNYCAYTPKSNVVWSV